MDSLTFLKQPTKYLGTKKGTVITTFDNVLEFGMIVDCDFSDYNNF